MCPTTSPDLYTSSTARDLRRRIQAIRIVRLHWSEFVFHYVMDRLGFGTSLTALPEHRLAALYELLRVYRPPRPAAFAFDPGSRWIYALQKKAGWSNSQLRHYLALTYQVTHPNLLTDAQKAEVRTLFTHIIAQNKGE